MINLSDFTNNGYLFGNDQGREVLAKLNQYIDSQTGKNVHRISLKGIKATDASFPRESVVSLAKQLRGEKWFCLEGFISQDLIDNWDYAANAKEQPLVIWDDKEYQLIGIKLNTASKKLFDYIFTRKEVTTAEVARDLDISVQNASTRLKKFANDGLVIRTEESAVSGGKEFIYRYIK